MTTNTYLLPIFMTTKIYIPIFKPKTIFQRLISTAVAGMCNAAREKIKRHMSTTHLVDKERVLSMRHLMDEQKDFSMSDHVEEEKEKEKVEMRRRVVSEKETSSNVDLTKGGGCCLKTSTSLIKVTGKSKRG